MADEKNFENRVKAFLKEQGCYFIKYWGGAVYTKSGVPDLIVCCNKRFLGVEVKAERGKPSELQIHHLCKIDKAGGIAVLLYPDDFEQFKILINAIIENNSLTIVLKSQALMKRWKHYEKMFDERRKE